MAQGVPDVLDNTLVDDTRMLPGALQAVDEPLVGLDVERDDSRRYFSHAALIQIGTGSDCVLIDPLAISDLGVVGAFLAERTTVLHSLENDLAPLASAGIRLHTGVSGGRRRVEDTQVAAAMLGLPTGLSSLLEEHMQVELPVDKDRYQRAAWEQRPLSEEMRRYAAADATYLPALWELLSGRLQQADRAAWYGQELLSTIEQARTDTRSWTRGTGAGGLEADERAVLKALWNAREALAREHDIAPNVLLRDQTLQSLARDPVDSPEELIERDSPRGDLAEHAQPLLAAQQRGRQAPPVPRETRHNGTHGARDTHDALRRVRNRTAQQLGIDPGVLCPNRQLWRAVDADPDSAAELAEAVGLATWQVQVLAEDLWEAYRHRGGEDGD